MIRKKVFESYTNSDGTEGRGHDVTIGYFTSEADALIAGEGQGVMGFQAPVRPKEIVIYESLEEYNNTRIKALREAALKKLTEQERKILGL